MHIDILTLFPEMFNGVFEHSILKRAKDKGIAEIALHDIRDYANNKHKQVDDYQFGGGGGMVMMVEPLAACIEHLIASNKELRTTNSELPTNYDEIIYLTPDGELFNQKIANELSMLENIILLCGHYKGIDQRIREKYITREISIGDYVLTGGELAAAVICDSIIRLMPGVLNDETSALSDSYQNDLLSPPVYTRPAEWKGMKVPDVLLSGNDNEIYKWRMDKAIEKTEQKRPQLLNL